MNRLLRCAEILGVLLVITQSVCTEYATVSDYNTTAAYVDPVNLSVAVTVTPKPPKTVSQETVQQSSPLPPAPQPTTSSVFFLKRECLQALLVSGGLIIACTFFLISTLILLWKVCQLSRRLKTLSSNGELISTSAYRVGAAKKNKSSSEAEVKETDTLMADISHTNQEMSNGTAKEDGGEVDEDGQEGEEKEAEDTPRGEEAPPPEAATESSPSSKSQEEAADSEPAANTAGAPISGGIEEL